MTKKSKQESYHKSFIKKSLQHRCFPVNIAKFLRTLNLNIITRNRKFLFVSRALHKKWSFPLRTSLVNVTKFAVSCGFGHIYWINPQRKTSFSVRWWLCFEEHLRTAASDYTTTRMMIMMMIMMMMMNNFFCGMVDRQKAFSLISSQDDFQRASLLQTSNTPGAGFKPPQNQNSDFDEWNYAVVMTTTPWRYKYDFSFVE